MRPARFLPPLAALAAFLTCAACSGDGSTDPHVSPAASVTIAPDTTTTFDGDTVRYTAVITDADGHTRPELGVTWTSSDPHVAALTANGQSATVAAFGPGSATITATSGGQQGTAALDVKSYSGIFALEAVSGRALHGSVETLVGTIEPDVLHLAVPEGGTTWDFAFRRVPIIVIGPP